MLRAPLFRGVPPALVATTSAGGEARALARGEKLLAAGTENRRLYLVVSGSLSVYLPLEEPANPTNTSPANPAISTLGEGDCVGELSVIDGRPVSADVIADEPSVVLTFDREQVWSLIDASAEVARNLLCVLAGRVRNDDTILGESGRLQRYFERIATVDGLTGLRNRRWLDEAFARQLERSGRLTQPVSLVMLDVDHFKQLNDDHGHLVGDALLARLAQILASTLRPQDLLARYGGEEFAVLLPGIDRQSGRLVAERLRLAVEIASAAKDERTLPPMTISLGVAERVDGESLDDLLRHADAAMYRAKQSGRNRVGS